MKRKHLFRSLLAAALALFLFAGDAAPAMAAKKVTQEEETARTGEGREGAAPAGPTASWAIRRPRIWPPSKRRSRRRSTP